MKHGTSLQHPSMVQSPGLYSLYPFEAANISRPPHSGRLNFVHRRNPESMTASGSQRPGPASVRNALGRPYQRGYLIFTILLSRHPETYLRVYAYSLPPLSRALNLSSTTTAFPVPQRPIDLTGGPFYLPPKMPIPQPLFQGRGKRRALIVRWHKKVYEMLILINF
jgi:hypothetical protein